MSEQSEQPVVTEREAGIVQRVANRVGKFLSETYTYKGATQKEIATRYGIAYSQFNDETRANMKKVFEQAATDKAHWNVIRNWIVTGGAGLGLWYGISHVGVAGMWKFVTDVAPKAIAKGAEGVFNWIFNPGTLNLQTAVGPPSWVKDIPFGSGLGIPFITGITVNKP